MKKFILYTIISLCTLTSCIEEFNADLSTSDTKLLVVDGTILSDSTSTFTLSWSMALNSSSAVQYPSGATVKIIGSDGTSVAGTDNGNGVFTVETPKLSASATYYVEITADGDIYRSEPQQPMSSTAIESVEAVQESENSNISVLITTATPASSSETQYYRWTYNETWEVDPDLLTNMYWDKENQCGVSVKDNLYPTAGWMYDTSSDMMFSSTSSYAANSNKISKYKLYDIANEVTKNNKRLQVLYCTEICQRSINKAEFEYETERRKISSEMGGLFTPQPSELPTNIKCTTSDKRAIGYIGCALTVAHKRLFISAYDGYNINRKYTVESVYSSDADFPGNDAMFDKGYALITWGKDALGEESQWAAPEYVDITLNSGISLEKPDYWK